MRHGGSTEDQLVEIAAAESRVKVIFMGSLLLSVLIVVQIAFQVKQVGDVLHLIRSVLPAVLLWSFAVTAYAFYSLWSIGQRRQRLLDMEFTDLATGVFSLPYLKSCLEQERRRADEGKRSAAVLYVDMVNLERVNRQFGYTVGDIVLKAVAQLIAGSARAGDVVGRVGGDEFLVIMPETRPSDAAPVEQAIQQAISGYDLDLGKRGSINWLSCKVARAAFPSEGETPEEIITAARRKLRPLGKDEETD